MGPYGRIAAVAAVTSSCLWCDGAALARSVGPSGSTTAAAVPHGAAARTRAVTLLGRLAALQRAFLTSSVRQSFVHEGHVRVLYYSPARWDQAKRRVDAYRRDVAELVLLPVGAFLTRPRLFVQTTEAITWGQGVAVGLPRYVRPGFDEVIPVLAVAERSSGSAPSTSATTTTTVSAR